MKIIIYIQYLEKCGFAVYFSFQYFAPLLSKGYSIFENLYS